MKNLILVSILLLAGCAEGDKSAAIKKIQTETQDPAVEASPTPEPEIEATPSPTPEPSPSATPEATPEPSATPEATPSPTPEPSPSPLALNCIGAQDGAHLGALCNGATWLDLRKLHHIDPSFYSVRVYRIDNDVIAQYNGTICPTANRVCKARSVCIYSFVKIHHNSPGETGYIKCGNKLEADRTLGME